MTEPHTAPTAQDSSFRLRVLRLVRMIPRGRVATYGQIAALAGRARAARAVGAILRRSTLADDVPWQRVINAQGRISSGGDMARPLIQRQLLEGEGVAFSRSGTCRLADVRWPGPPEALPWED